jgi:hypothetical protein
MQYAFYKGYGTALDKLICLWERGPYSHVEAVLEDHGDGTYTVASSVPFVGIRTDRIALPADEWDLIEGPGDVEKVRQWFKDHDGVKYDYMALFGFILRPIAGEKGRYFCSESILTALGFQEPWRFDPNAMADSIRFAYQGALSEY